MKNVNFPVECCHNGKGNWDIVTPDGEFKDVVCDSHLKQLIPFFTGKVSQSYHIKDIEESDLEKLKGIYEERGNDFRMNHVKYKENKSNPDESIAERVEVMINSSSKYVVWNYIDGILVREIYTHEFEYDLETFEMNP